MLPRLAFKNGFLPPQSSRVAQTQTEAAAAHIERDEDLAVTRPDTRSEDGFQRDRPSRVCSRSSTSPTAWGLTPPSHWPAASSRSATERFRRT